MLWIEAVAAVAEVTDMMSGRRVGAVPSDVKDGVEEEGCLSTSAGSLKVAVLLEIYLDLLAEREVVGPGGVNLNVAVTVSAST